MATRDFRLVPSEGFHPLLLGITGEQVKLAMGEVPKVSARRSLPLDEDWLFPASYAHVSLRAGLLVEASVTPPATVWLQGQSLFEAEGLWRELVATDGNAHEALGFLVLQRLGLALTGFHDSQTEQLSITIFEASRSEQYSKRGKPFNL